jgi:hypothetical protein
MKWVFFIALFAATASCATVLDFDRLHETKPDAAADASCDAGDC